MDSSSGSSVLGTQVVVICERWDPASSTAVLSAPRLPGATITEPPIGATKRLIKGRLLYASRQKQYLFDVGLAA